MKEKLFQRKTAIRENLSFRSVPALLLFMGWGWTAAPAVVGLSSFTAERMTGNRVQLRWATATEIDTAGFYVRRSNRKDADFHTGYRRIGVTAPDEEEEIEFIPAQGDGLLGAEYSFIDPEAPAGSVYYYVLEEVDSSQSVRYYGPIVVIPD